MNNPTRQHNLTNQDLEVIKSFALPIQLNVPLADNPKEVTTVLLMMTCGMLEHTHFGTNPPAQDMTFESDEAGYGLELFLNVAEFSDIEQAATKYLHYLRTGRYDGDMMEDETRKTRQEILNGAPKRNFLSRSLYRFSVFLDRILW